MKKLFAVIMSLQLIIAPVAMAQGSGDQYRENSAGGNSTASYMKQILGLSTGIIGSNIITACKHTHISTLLYFAGSLVFIGSEVFAGKSQNQLKDKKIKDIKMVADKMKLEGEGGELQKELLEQALQEEKDTNKFIKNRKNWMTAIAVIYWASMAMAIIEAILNKIPTINYDDSGMCQGSDETLYKILSYSLVAAWSWGTSKAGGGGTISTIGGFASALLPMVDAQGKIVSVAYESGVARAITFGVSGVLSTWIAVDLGQKQKAVEENIEKMDKAIKAFKGATETTTTVAEDDENPNQDEDKGGDEEKINIKRLASELPKSCFSNTPRGMDYSEGGCKSPLKFPKANFHPSVNIPTLSNVSNLAGNMAQAMANGDMAGAGNIAGQIAGMAAQVKKVKDGLEKQLNDKLKAAGKPQIDFDKRIQERMAGMEAQFMKATNTPASKLANTNNASMDDLVKESSKNSTPEMVAAVQPSIAAPTAGMPEFSESLNEEDPSIQSGVSVTEGLDQFESSVEDIAKTPEVSIFKQVSNRYILNYTKIFERRKTPEPVADEPKK